MQPIKTTIQEFTTALNDPYAVTCDKSGNWYVEGFGWRILRILFPCVRNSNLVNIGKAFNRCMEDLERMKKEFDCPHKLLADAVRKCLESSTDKNVRKELTRLNLRCVATEYRCNKTPDEKDDKDIHNQLCFIAKQWKNRYELYEGKPLSEAEIKKINRAKVYPEFADLLEKDRCLQDQFFKWALRDDNDVDVFVQFPFVAERLKNSLLSARIGRFAKEELLSIHEQDGYKDLKLLFEGKAISILNDAEEVTFNNGTTKKTVGAALKVFADKNKEIGDLEIFGHGDKKGVRFWNPHEWMENVNLKEDKWWENLPVFEELTLSEVNLRYGTELKEGQWLFLGGATSETLIPDVDKSHGMEHVLIPVDKKYRLYPMGKFAKEFPQDGYDNARFLANTVPGVKSYPDENAFYSHRQIALHPVVFSEDEGKKLMEIEARKAQEEQIFQFAAENCAFEPQSTLEEVKGKENVPQMYLQSALESRPTNPFLKVIFAFLRHLRTSWHAPGLAIVAHVLGAKRGITITVNSQKVFKSVEQSDFMQHGKIYQPGHLHQQIRNNDLKGVITYGHLQLRERTERSSSQ